MAILITGGAGYVGSHAVRALLDRGETVVVLDDLSTGYEAAIDSRAKFYCGAIQNRDLLKRIFTEQKIEGVLHFAAKSLVGESVQVPLKYYEHNVHGTQVLLECMIEHDITALVFSSTAAVYGEPRYTPIDEAHPTEPISPYGASKRTMEQMMHWAAKAHGLKFVALRYFNVAGAHYSGTIGEAHNPETHIIPIVLQVPLGQRDQMTLFGSDYNTADGTCVRDYIHIEDLIDAHILALNYLKSGGESDVFNLGTETGFSNCEVVAAARVVTGHEIPVTMGERRLGDPAVLVASSGKARKMLGWHPKRTALNEIIASAWAFQKAHPNGYSKREESL